MSASKTHRPGPLGQRMAAELRAELARQRRSGRWLSLQINAPHNTVARWLAGESIPGVDAVDAMCNALGIRMTDLVYAIEQESMPHPRRRTGDRELALTA